MTTHSVMWHPDALDAALVALIKARDDFDDITINVDPIRARARLAKVVNDLFLGNNGHTIPAAIDALRAIGAGS